MDNTDHGEPTLAQHERRARVAAQLRELRDTLSLAPSAVAALLRNADDSYPTASLVRLMLSETQNPSDRFEALLSARLAEVRDQLQAGVLVSTIAGQYQQMYRVESKRHLITVIPEADLAGAEYQRPDQLATIVMASLAVPAEWIATCPVCKRVFVRRNSRQGVCRRTDAQGRYPCVTEQARKRRAYRRELGGG